jgi:hypothetical protein
MKPPRTMSLFARWIKEYGPRRLADDLGVSIVIVQKWARMSSVPKIVNAAIIMKIAKHLTLNDIYGHIINKR